jgi:hypothetical protein
MREMSFNDMLMLFVAVPLILVWLSAASYVIYVGVNDSTGFVQQNLDFYTALIAIIGGPALLFINAILELWKAEKSSEALDQRHRHKIAEVREKNGNGHNAEEH